MCLGAIRKAMGAGGQVVQQITDTPARAADAARTSTGAAVKTDGTGSNAADSLFGTSGRTTTKKKTGASVPGLGI